MDHDQVSRLGDDGHEAEGGGVVQFCHALPPESVWGGGRAWKWLGRLYD